MKPTIYSRDDHSLSRRNIDPDALKIIYRLTQHGFKAYVVGGGVRDLLLGKRPKDFDIATDATPRKVKALFRNCRIIGRRFKLAHVYFHNNKIIEVATFRDISDPVSEENGADTDGPLMRDNKYGTEETDALRRDVTINALFYDPNNFSIIDYVGGMKDLSAGVIRVIGDPEERFREDPVRMLRAVRYAAKAGFELEKRCEKAIERNHELLLQSAPMRLYEELKKDFGSGFSLQVLSGLSRHRLLQLLIPEIEGLHYDLLGDQSGFPKGLARADELIQTGQEVTSTDILTLLALFIREGQTKREFPDLFEDQEEIAAFVKKCFRVLAVPRKERERMIEVLNFWHKLQQTPLERIRPAQLARNPELARLKMLLLLTEPRSKLLAVLEDAEHPHEHQEPRGGRTPPGRKAAARALGPRRKETGSLFIGT